jgi:hypothetical protein
MFNHFLESSAQACQSGRYSVSAKSIVLESGFQKVLSPNTPNSIRIVADAGYRRITHP